MIKNRIRQWLGINDLDSRVSVIESKKRRRTKAKKETEWFTTVPTQAPPIIVKSIDPVSTTGVTKGYDKH